MAGRMVGLALAFCLVSAAAPAEEATVGRDVAFGCQNPYAYATLMRYASDGDSRAVSRLLSRLARVGECVRFRTGERVYVDGRAEPWVRIRRPGHIAAYWIDSDDIWSHWP